MVRFFLDSISEGAAVGESVQPTYSMRLVTRMTGLTADTVRAWERRYSAIIPRRTEGGTRRYTAEDVERLKLLKEASSRGHPLGDLAKLDDEALQALVVQRDQEEQAPVAGEGDTDTFLTRYLEAILLFEERRAYGYLSRAAAVLEPREFVYTYILPLLHRTGDMWHAGELSIAHEHLITEQVRYLLHALHHRREAAPGAQLVMVATPPEHHHEFGAMVGAYLVSANGHRQLYLGPNVPWEDLSDAVRRSRANAVVLSVVRSVSENEARRMRKGLLALANEVDVWLGVPEDHALSDMPAPIKVFTRFEAFDAALAALPRSR